MKVALSIGRRSSALLQTGAVERCGLLARLLGVLWAGAALAGPAQFVDEARCGSCHQAELKAWTGSHHDLAMQPATEQTVLGDFRDARFTHGKVTTRFFRRGGRFFVSTDGPTGKQAEFEVKFTFGLDPLQQYLLELPRGRLQALSIAWDTQHKRWFHLYPKERIDFADELHWTAPSQNWNFMCGECHTTGYRKGYDAGTDSYQTTSARSDVGCQACHGPGSRHLEWSASFDGGTQRRPPAEARRDFDVDLAGKDSRTQVEACAPCHSRRSTLLPTERHGKPLMDTHLPSLLSEGLYFADGQIQDEDFEYGSFLQSKMYAKGIRCSDCHEPHSGKPRAAGDALCISCHNAKPVLTGTRANSSGLKARDYAAPSHTFHQPGTKGSGCVECHAPTRDYMVVHPRHDHSFRIPRPDLSVTLGTPNACTGCHAQQGAPWAAAAVAKWYGPGRRQEPHPGQALDAGRNAKPGAVPQLVALAGDRAQPGIMRASALDLLHGYPGAMALAALRRGLGDADPLVRRAAATGLERLSPQERLTDLTPLLADPVRAVRMEAARLLAPAASAMEPHRRTSLDQALAEFEAAQREISDRPEGATNLANLALSRGELAPAEAGYRKAIALEPRFVPAYVNLADLYRSTGREADAEKVLRQGLAKVPGAPGLRGALGLTLTRQGKKAQALVEFAAAAKAAPREQRHSYVYAIALDDAGRRAEATKVLEVAAQRQGDRDVLLALASFKARAGDQTGAQQLLRTLATINPDDPAVAGRAP